MGRKFVDAASAHRVALQEVFARTDDHVGQHFQFAFVVTVDLAGSPSALVSKDDTLFESPDCRRQLKWVAPATPEAAAGLTTRAVNDELTNIYTPKMKRQLSAVSRDGIPLSWHARQPGWDALGVLPQSYAEAAKLRF